MDADEMDILAAKRAVLGDEHPGADIAALDFASPLMDWTKVAVWQVWARPGLPIRERCLITVTTLAILNRPDFLAIHIRGALRNGVTPKELCEAFTQIAVYAGVVTANDALRVLAQVTDQQSS